MRSLLFRPRSVPGLLIVGFSAAALPLLVAVIFSVFYVDKFSSQTTRLVIQGVQVTRYSRQLADNLTSMERAARQYRILQDPALAEQFAEHHKAFLDTLDEFSALNLATLGNWELQESRRQVQGIADDIAAGELSEQTPKSRFGVFNQIRSQINTITSKANQFVYDELEKLQTTSQDARAFMILCAITLLPITLLLVLLFTLLISRPIKQVQQAMRQMGEGDFGTPAVISAPSKELDELGNQLDWMRRRLSELDDEKNQFLRSMSHELKTPLASIREGVELVRDGTLGRLNERQAEVVDILHKSSLELLRLIDNLLNFAAWRHQRTGLQSTWFNLRELVAQIISRHRLTIGKKQLDVSYPPEALELYADRDQMRSILDNLIANAINFSPEHGRLRIDANHHEDGVIIEVSDDGPGIPATEEERIFAPFYQAQKPEHTHVAGTGIGLSVVREGVRLHNGRIDVVDSVHAKGACFRITLPKPHRGTSRHAQKEHQHSLYRPGNAAGQ